MLRFDCPTRPRLLQIDADPVSQRDVTTVLDAAGYKVISLCDPLRAIDTILRGQHRLVVMDALQPAVSGVQLLREIKSHDAGIRVVIHSASIDLALGLELVAAGAEALVVKPVGTGHDLLVAIDAAQRCIDRWSGVLRLLTRQLGQLPTAG